MRAAAIEEDPQLEVLFVQNDPMLADMYRLKLELDGYRVTIVDSRDAVRQASTRKPDLVFIDLPVERPEPLRLLGQLRRITGRDQLPAVVLAEGGDAALREHGIELGPCDYAVRVGAVRSMEASWLLSA